MKSTSWSRRASRPVRWCCDDQTRKADRRGGGRRGGRRRYRVGGDAARAPDVPTAVVERGRFVDAVQMRGEVKAGRSITIIAPSDAGDLRIMKLVRNGTSVKKGDVLIEFDGVTVNRTLDEKKSEVRGFEAQIEQSRSESQTAEQKSVTAEMTARLRRGARQARLLGQGDPLARRGRAARPQGERRPSRSCARRPPSCRATGSAARPRWPASPASAPSPSSTSTRPSGS